MALTCNCSGCSWVRETITAAHLREREPVYPQNTAFLGRPIAFWQKLEQLARQHHPALLREAAQPDVAYLFLGGPWRGRRVVTDERPEYRVPELRPLSLKDANSQYAAQEIRCHLYRRERITEGTTVITVYTYEGLSS